MADGNDTPQITLSDRAAKRVARILSTEPEGSMLRVAVLGGGCSGFQYDFQIVTSREDDDLVLEKDGAVVLIDEMSQQYMPGAEIDYTEELIAAAFTINNPIAQANCGCGTSFSI
ncbi:MAG: iron-sulfur cluster insertion protein ErpA [Pseudomonadota bacterium]